MGILYHTITMYRSVLALVIISTLAQAHPQPKDLICDICIDVVTDLDTWLTSDATEGEIVHFMESLCRALGNILPDLETMCIDLMEAQLPAIIDGLVEENLNPMEVCVNIAACYPPPPTTTGAPAPTTGAPGTSTPAPPASSTTAAPESDTTQARSRRLV